MYLHIGGDFVVKMNEIVGIMDIENSSIGEITKEFLKSSQQCGDVINVSFELPKSFIIVKENEETKVYISPISTGTLYKRAGMKRQSVPML